MNGTEPVYVRMCKNNLTVDHLQCMVHTDSSSECSTDGACRQHLKIACKSTKSRITTRPVILGYVIPIVFHIPYSM